ncbi:MAG: hypothetical protein ACRC8K_18385 [Waterburya sp.]
MFRTEGEIHDEIDRLSNSKYRAYKDERSWAIYNNETKQICKRYTSLNACAKWVDRVTSPRLTARETVRKLTNGSLSLISKKGGKYLLRHNQSGKILASAYRASILVDLVKKEYCFLCS